MTPIISTLLAVSLGSILALESQILLVKYNSDFKKKEKLLNLYSEWISGIEVAFFTYISRGGKPIPYKHIENQIKLLENNKKILQQMSEIHDHFPDYRSEEYDEIYGELMSDPHWDDTEFRKKINKLTKLIKDNF